MATSNTTSRGRRLRELPVKAGPKTLRRVLRERRSGLRRGRIKRASAILLALLLLGYGALPTDLLPDTLPRVGLLDDLVLLPLGFLLVVQLLLRAQQERRLARHVAAGGDPATLPEEGPAKRRRNRLRGAVLVLLGTALGLAAASLGQQVFPGATPPGL